MHPREEKALLRTIVSENNWASQSFILLNTIKAEDEQFPLCTKLAWVFKTNVHVYMPDVFYERHWSISYDAECSGYRNAFATAETHKWRRQTKIRISVYFGELVFQMFVKV